jgi:serine protease
MGRDACFFVMETRNSGVVTQLEAQSPSRFRPSAVYHIALFAALAAVFLSGTALAAAPGGGAQTPPQALQYTDRLIVKLKPATGAAAALGVNVTTAQDLSAGAGVTLRTVSTGADGRRVLALPGRMTEAEVEDIAARLRADPAVEYAEPDRVVYPSSVPNDPYFYTQWDFKGPDDSEPGGADITGAWDVTTGDAAVVIAAVDTGILPHTDLAGRVLPGYDFITDARTANDGDGRDADPSDPGDWVTSAESAGTDAGGYFSGCAVANSTWHGTHVAGTLVAATDNDTGVAGINWKSNLLPLRALGKCGGYSSDIADAVRWAAGLPVNGVPDNPHPAQVINLSLSGKGACGLDEQQAINAAIAAGSIVVIAAGNGDGDAADYHPGNCAGVINVAAADRSGGRASYSNYGAGVAITAPGGGTSAVYSTLDHGTRGPLDDNSYGFFIGTSMATAHVSGVVSLMLSANYALTHTMLPRTTVLSRLRAAARAFPVDTGTDCTTQTCGAGLLDGAAAVRAVSDPPVAHAGADTTVDGGTMVHLSGTAASASGGRIVAYAWTQTAGSAVVLNNANTATPSFIAPGGSDILTFRLTVTDDAGLSAADTVNVTVAGSNGAPVANILFIATDEDTAYVGNLSAMDQNDAPLTYSIVANGDKGAAEITDAATGQFIYTPNLNANGADSFTFKVNNGGADSNVATVSVTIHPVNDAPVATDAVFSMAPDSPLTARLTAGDVDGDGLVYSVITSPQYGTVTVTDAAGHFTYAAYAEATGSDSFTYTVSDGHVESNTATVMINFDGNGHNPTLTANGVNGLVLASGAVASVPFTVTDAVAGLAPPVYSVAPPLLGTAAFSDNVLTYTAAVPGTELLAVSVMNGHGDTDARLIPVTVSAAGAADSNGDGLGDAQATAIGLDIHAAGGDSDGDGLADVYEVGDPAHPTDSDGDGVIDALEVGAAAGDPARMTFVVVPDTAAALGLVALAGGTVSVTADTHGRLLGRINGETGIPLYDKASAAGADSYYDYPLGLLDYSVITSSRTVTVTVTLPGGAALPDNAVVRKMDVDGLWQTVPGSVIDAANNSITLTLTDNDAFDLDPTVGVIRDPLGVATAAAVATDSLASSYPAAGAGQGGGGGLGPAGLLVMGLLLAGRRRSRRS